MPVGRWRGLLVATALAVLPNVAGRGAPAAKRGPEYPLYCAGIVVGMSNDRDVRRMYGNGYLVRYEGHGGGRYFVDPNLRVTLHAETGVGGVIQELTYSSGVHLPKYAGHVIPKSAVSPALTADEWVYLDTSLGASPAQVVQADGKPQSDVRRGKQRTLRYVTHQQAMAYTLEYEGEFRFENDRLISVRLFNGE